MTVLVTGAAAIGYTQSAVDQRYAGGWLRQRQSLLRPCSERARLGQLKATAKRTGSRFELIEADLENRAAVEAAFAEHRPTKVVNLAAQAGVRYSIENPSAYIQANLVGFGHILEGCRRHAVNHLVYASSSSVYGGNTQMPFSERHSVDHPVSLCASKRLMNNGSYIATSVALSTGLRFSRCTALGTARYVTLSVYQGDVGGAAIEVFVTAR